MIGVIGGSGFEDALSDCDWSSKTVESIATEFGSVSVTTFTSSEGSSIAFLPRHGNGHTVAPHLINHHANLSALAHYGAKSIVSTSAVGGLRGVYHPGDFVVVSDFIDLRTGSPTTLFSQDKVVHTDFSDPFSHKLRVQLTGFLNQAIYDASKARNGIGACVYPEGVYICVSGPRYETPAEVRWFASMGGDVVGMTVAPEAILAREMGLDYASISVITNLGTGLSSTPLSHDEVVEMMSEARPTVVAAIIAAASR